MYEFIVTTPLLKTGGGVTKNFRGLKVGVGKIFSSKRWARPNSRVSKKKEGEGREFWALIFMT